MAKIAIVGSGPSGCYVAQALRKLDKHVEIDIIDRMPVPYGLVRYGVAPDHQGTKAVTRQFARLFEKQGVRFIGNVMLGEDGLPLEDLRAAYDVVVLALGLSKDRVPAIPGADLAGVIGAGQLTRHWNDHPDEAGALPQLGENVVIVGQGNVAIDVLRILAKREPDFEGSDLHLRHTDHITASGVQNIDILGRSPAHMAKFDPVMVKELAKLPHVSFAMEGVDLSAAGDDPRLEALASLPADVPDASHRVTFRFGWTPERLVAAGDKVAHAEFCRGDETLNLPCDTVITAIGFESHAPGVRDALLGEATDPNAGVVQPGLYLTGWFCRGPRGTIPENRQAAQALAGRIMQDLSALPVVERPGHKALEERFPDLVDYEGWLRIEAAENDASAPGRVRAKLTDLKEMLSHALGQMEKS